MPQFALVTRVEPDSGQIQDAQPAGSLSRPRLAGMTRRAVTRLTLGVAAGLGLSSCLPPDPAAARRRKKRKNKKKETVIDRRQTRVDTVCNGQAITSVDLAAPQRLGQPFTASRTGELVKAEILIGQDANTSGDYVLRLATLDAGGVPTNTSLASARIPGASVPEGESVLAFTFTSPATVDAGTGYALVLTREATAFIGLYAGDACGGQLYRSLSANGAFTPISGPPPYNLIFSTFIRA